MNSSANTESQFHSISYKSTQLSLQTILRQWCLNSTPSISQSLHHCGQTNLSEGLQKKKKEKKTSQHHIFRKTGMRQRNSCPSCSSTHLHTASLKLGQRGHHHQLLFPRPFDPDCSVWMSGALHCLTILPLKKIHSWVRTCQRGSRETACTWISVWAEP